jgi:hypothetical protein
MLPVYDLTIDGDDELGVDAISLVATPAIRVGFVALAENEPVRKVVLAEQMLYGAVLIPEQPIYRNDDGVEYYIKASADTIQNVAYKFVKTGKQLNLNLEHSNEPITGFVAESWIIRDKNNDKSKAVGLDMDLPVGTWCIGVKVEDAGQWEKLVESGLVKGFSLEGAFNHIKLSNQDEMSVAEDIAKRFEAQVNKLMKRVDRVLMSKDNKNQKRVQLTATQSVTIIRPEGFALGGRNWTEKLSVTIDKTGKARVLCAEDGVTEPLTDGEYITEDGKKLEVTAGEAELVEEMEQQMAVQPNYRLEDGTGIYVDSATGEVFVVAEDGSTGVAPDGEHMTDSGDILVVSGGKLAEKRQKEAEMGTEKPAENTEMSEIESLKEALMKVLGIVEGMQTATEEMREQFKCDKEAMESQIEKMSQALSAVPGAKWTGNAKATQHMESQKSMRSNDPEKQRREMFHAIVAERNAKKVSK